MLKTKYERMNHSEKKEVLENYKKTEVGKVMMGRLFRLIFIGILGIMYSFFLLVGQWNKLKWTDFFVIVPLSFISVFFIVMSFRLKKKVLNQFVIKNKKI